MTAVRDRSALDRRVGGLVGGGLLLLVVLPLALLVDGRWSPLQRLDEGVTTGLHDVALAHPWLNDVAGVLTAGGTSWFRYVVLLPVVAWLFWRRDRRSAAFAGLAAISIGPLTSGLKELVGRARPEVSDPGETLRSLSHPSGHSSGIAVTVGVLLVLAWPVLSRRWRRVAAGCGAVLIGLVALTRLLLGVHYLTDVVAGVSLGAAWVVLLAVALGVLRSGVPKRDGVEYGRTRVRQKNDDDLTDRTDDP